ncbi:MAG TPA: hypothetical protein ENH89_17980, partial [Aurantimonas coralicida]|nr:hypothetical protein [Aurantimonas coralicida]
MVPLPQGGAARRPGSRYVAEVKNSSVKPWLVPFEFSTIQAYILEFGNLALRFYKDQGQITAADITASITNGDFPSGIA